MKLLASREDIMKMMMEEKEDIIDVGSDETN